MTGKSGRQRSLFGPDPGTWRPNGTASIILHLIYNVCMFISFALHWVVDLVLKVRVQHQRGRISSIRVMVQGWPDKQPSLIRLVWALWPWTGLSAVSLTPNLSFCLSDETSRTTQAHPHPAHPRTCTLLLGLLSLTALMLILRSTSVISGLFRQ